MTQSHEELLELASGFVFGTLDADELQAFEAHLERGCEECEEEIAAAAAAADELVRGAAPAAPSDLLRQRLMARARGDVGSSRPNRGVHGGWRWAAMLTGVALLASLFTGLQERRSSSEAERSLLAEVDTMRGTLETLEADRRDIAEELERYESMVGTATAVGVRAVNLAGPEPTGDSRARAFVDASEGRLLLVVDQLPTLPVGQTYQLWVIVEGTPVSVGIFDIHTDGTARLGSKVDIPLGRDITVAVSVEPAGGVPQPTGPIVLAGT